MPDKNPDKFPVLHLFYHAPSNSPWPQDSQNQNARTLTNSHYSNYFHGNFSGLEKFLQNFSKRSGKLTQSRGYNPKNFSNVPLQKNSENFFRKFSGNFPGRQNEKIRYAAAHVSHRKPLRKTLLPGPPFS